ncbi:MAG: UDP-N-acetylmuramoyl-tripeptide--D-alanyl-D-alanine ligase [Bacteroidota bacterium]
MSELDRIYSLFRNHPVICTDTRKLSPGCIFFALKGPSFNGNAFASSALAAGASYAIVDEQEYATDSRCILVSDVLTALQDLAHHHRRRLKIPVLAITGSNGKTTTKELVKAVLSKKFKTLATQGNLNNHIGVPLTLLSITDDIEFAVVEMGANHQQEIASYCLYAEPDFGLITNVGKAHLEGFGGFEGVKKGKGELYSFLSDRNGLIFINADNPHLTGMADDRRAGRLFSYGSDASSDCKGKLIAEQPFLTVAWACGDKKGEAHSQLVGRYNFENILSAISIGCHFGVEPAEIDAAIAGYCPDNSRSQLLKRGSNTIVLDAYNANPTSMEAALRNFEAMPGANKVVCIGDMAELGTETAAEHERIISILSAMGFPQVILVGKNFGKLKDQISCEHFDQSEAAAEWIRNHSFNDCTVLIKGSRSTRMERVLDAIV